MIYKGLFALFFVLTFSGCSNQMTSTLLTSYKGCTGTACSNSSSLSGEISLSLDDPSGYSYGTPSETTDLVEIAGSCQDLNIRNNRILVQVFDSELSTGVPYIDNSRDVYCDDVVNTKEYRSVVSGGVTVKQQCFFVSNGVGLADENGALYPQCFNGRFAFKVRVGRVVRKDPYIADGSDNNPVVPYTVRMKIRAVDNVPLESSWVTIPVSRYVSSPKVDATASSTTMRIELNVYPAKFRDIRYSISYSWAGPTHVLSVSGTPATFTNSASGTIPTAVFKKPDFPIKSDGTSIDNFWIDNLYAGGTSVFPTLGVMPGVTYNFDITASDFQYDYLTYPGPGFIDRGTSTTVTVVMAPARISENNPINGKNTCLFSLVGANTRGGYSLEWRYSTNSSWMDTDPNSGTVMSSCKTTQCYVNLTSGGFTVGNIYYFAARTYYDQNANGSWDPGEVVGKWSTVVDPAGVYSCQYQP